MLDINTILIAASSLVSGLALLAVIFSKRVRRKLIKGLISDYTEILIYSEMGKRSGDSKFKSKIEGILQNSMGGLISRVASDNPIVQIALDYLINETEIGDFLTDERTLPIILGFVQRNTQGVDLNQLLGGLNPQKKEIGYGGYGQ